MIHKDIAPADTSGHVRAHLAAQRAHHALAHRAQQSDTPALVAFVACAAALACTAAARPLAYTAAPAAADS